MNQIELIAAIAKELDRQGIKTLFQRQMNAVITAADAIIRELRIAPVMASYAMGLSAWCLSDDTGQSSKYMAAVLSGVGGNYAHPHDLDDFGRCSRLLNAVPEFRERLELMRDVSRQWSNLVDVWVMVESVMAENPTEANRIVLQAVS